MKKMLFIYNPKSGQGQIRSRLSGILEKLSAGGYDITVYPTKENMDAFVETIYKNIMNENN